MFEIKADLSKMTELINKNVEDLQKDVKKLAIETANKTKQQAQSLAPVDTGELRQSIHSNVDDNNGVISAEVWTNLKYAVYVEYGTGERGKETNKNTEKKVSYTSGYAGQVAQPYMYPAFVKYRDKWKKQIEEVTKKL